MTKEAAAPVTEQNFSLDGDVNKQKARQQYNRFEQQQWKKRYFGAACNNTAPSFEEQENIPVKMVAFTEIFAVFLQVFSVFPCQNDRYHIFVNRLIFSHALLLISCQYCSHAIFQALFEKRRNAQRREIFSPIKANFCRRADARQEHLTQSGGSRSTVWAF